MPMIACNKIKDTCGQSKVFACLFVLRKTNDEIHTLLCHVRRANAHEQFPWKSLRLLCVCCKDATAGWQNFRFRFIIILWMKKPINYSHSLLFNNIFIKCSLLGSPQTIPTGYLLQCQNKTVFNPECAHWLIDVSSPLHFTPCSKQTPGGLEDLKCLKANEALGNPSILHTTMASLSDHRLWRPL